jgi:hypothetical protein
MPGVPYLNPFVQYAGFQFDYNSAFLSCCTEYAVGTSTIASAISSFNTASISSLTVSSINGMTPGAGGASSSNVLVVNQVLPQTIGSNGSAYLALTTELDPNNWWNGSNYSFKPLVAGYYFLSAQLTFNPTITDSNELYLGIYDNANSVFVAKTIQTGAYFNGSNSQTLTTTALHYFDGLATNISLLAYNGTGASLSVTTGGGLTSLQAFQIGGSTGATGLPGSTLSTFNTASISSATISSLNGWSPDTQLSSLYNLSTVVGGNTDPLTLSGSLWSYSRYAENVSDTNLGSIQVLSTSMNTLSTVVGGSNDVSTLTGSLWSYSKQAEADAQKSSMSWDFEGTGLGHSTSNMLPSPYTWNSSNYQHIWTFTATIPPGWQGRGNTFISLFIWNTFATNVNTQQYYDYSINGGSNIYLGYTSPTRPFTNSGSNQLVPITGNLVGISLSPTDTVVIRYFGKFVSGGTHNQTNATTEKGWGVFTASF